MFINDRDFYLFMLFMVLIGVAIGAAIFIGLPWLWSLLKPWLHAITA